MLELNTQGVNNAVSPTVLAKRPKTKWLKEVLDATENKKNPTIKLLIKKSIAEASKTNTFSERIKYVDKIQTLLGYSDVKNWQTTLINAYTEMGAPAIDGHTEKPANKEFTNIMNVLLKKLSE